MSLFFKRVFIPGLFLIVASSLFGMNDIQFLEGENTLDYPSHPLTENRKCYMKIKSVFKNNQNLEVNVGLKYINLNYEGERIFSFEDLEEIQMVKNVLMGQLSPREALNKLRKWEKHSDLVIFLHWSPGFSENYSDKLQNIFITKKN
jgi:hypothetical protein